MSIFSRLRRRGEDGSAAESPPSAQPSAPPPKSPSPTSAAPPPARAPEPTKSPANGAEAARPAPAAAREQPVRVPASSAPPRGNVQSPVAGAIGTPAALASPRAAVTARPAVSPAAKAPFPAAAPAAAAAAAPSPAPIAIAEPAGGSLDLAIAQALENSSVRRVAAAQAAPSAPPPPPHQGHGKSTESDEAALRETFEALAVSHVTPIRNAMMEVRFGEAQASWLEMGRPALKSLRSMASEVGHEALVAAVDGFVGALQDVLEPGKPPEVSGPSRETLLAAYAPLATCLPRAFALEGERDRREPIVVRALLEQVSELEPLMIDKLIAAGLGTLTQLFAARADEIAAVTGIPGPIAAAVAARIEAFHRSTPAALATVDPAATIRELVKLLDQLRAENAAFDQAARGWTPDDRQTKKQLRQRRQTTFLQITIALVRLGEIDFALRLPKLAFARRIEDLDRVVTSRAAAIRSQPPAPAAEAAAPAEERVVVIDPDEADGLSGPHPAAA